MFRQCTLVTFAPDARDDARHAIAERLAAAARDDGAVVHHHLGAAVPGGSNGGDLVWHVHFHDEPGWATSAIRALSAALPGDPAIDHVDSCAYRPVGAHVREAGIAGGIYRALFLAVKPGTPADTVARFARDTAAMPGYIAEIRNWALSPVAEAQGARAWTHVWEQEFRTIGDLRGPYMTSPYHWGYVDRWFDPEHHDFIVDTLLCHSASALSESVIALYDDAARAS
jgi:hypothetical protein